MKPNKPFYAVVLSAMIMASPGLAFAESKPNILFLVADDHSYGDSGPYGGGEGRDMPTPSLDRMADLLVVLRPAELHAGACCDVNRTHTQP